MKLHLPKKFQTALMAAIATVSFSTVSTATLAAAAFTFAGYQAAADETADAPELTSEEKEAEEKLNEEMEDSIQAQEEEEKEESKLTTHAIDLDAMKNLSNRFERGGDAASHQLAQQAYAAMETEMFTPEASAAPQQQATATSRELPSDDLGFTASPYATGSTGNSGPVFEVTPAAPAADFLQDSPAETRSSGSTSGATSPAPVSASGFGGGAAGGNSPSGYAAPAARPLSVSVAPTALAAPASVAAPAAVAAPSPKLAAADTSLAAVEELEYIFTFNDGETEVKYQKQDSYDLTVAAGKKGVITFNEALSGQLLEVTGDFKMNGANFEIYTSGATIMFDQSLSNYTTAFTITGGGEIVAKSDAAFGSLNVANGKLTIQSQIGVISGATIGAQGNLTVEEGAKLLLTTPIVSNGGNLVLKGNIDASNLPNATAQTMGVKFVNLQDESSTSGSGFLAAGTWNIATETSTFGADTIISPNARLTVATSDFELAQNGNKIQVNVADTDYRLWFQNGGTLESVIDVVEKASAEGSELVSFLVTGGEINPQDGQRGPLTVAKVDDQISDGNVIYVARGAGANIQLTGKYNEQYDVYDVSGSIGALKCLDNSYTEITSFYSYNNPVTDVSIIGQNVAIKAVRSVDPKQAVYDERENEHPCFSPANMTVEAASSGTISGDIKPYFGYFVGRDTETHVDYRMGTYDIKGELTIAEGFVMDLSIGEGAAQWTYKTEEGLFNEYYTHLFVSQSGGAIKLENEAEFHASTIDDGKAVLNTDGTNLDTSRNTETPDDANLINGTVVISSDGNATLTYTGIDTLDGKDVRSHYTTRNKDFKIANATVTVTDDVPAYVYEEQRAYSDTTLSNELNGSSVINDKQDSHGKVTLDNMKNQNFKTIHAKEGDIAITNRDPLHFVIDDEPTWKPEDVSAATVQIGAAKTVSATGNVGQEYKKATLNVSSLLKAEGYKGDEEGKDYYSKIDANLNLAVGVTLDVSAAKGTGGIDMQGNVVAFSGEYGDAPLTLSQTDYEQAWAMEKGGMYDLFHDVSAFAMYTGSEPWTDPISEDWQMDASQFFSNLKEGWFYLCYSGAATAGGNGNNVGTIYLYSLVPEPTTGTLSLLALAALAARRRRKG